jgi:hypothetical protein
LLHVYRDAGCKQSATIGAQALEMPCHAHRLPKKGKRPWCRCYSWSSESADRPQKNAERYHKIIPPKDPGAIRLASKSPHGEYVPERIPVGKCKDGKRKSNKALNCAGVSPSSARRTQSTHPLHSSAHPTPTSPSEGTSSSSCRPNPR